MEQQLASMTLCGVGEFSHTVASDRATPMDEHRFLLVIPEPDQKLIAPRGIDCCGCGPSSSRRGPARADAITGTKFVIDGRRILTA